MKARRPVTVLIVDRSAIVREALRWVIEELAGVRVVGEAAGGRAALELAAHQRPDLVILDATLVDQTGPGVGHQLKQSPRPPIIIVLTGAQAPSTTLTPSTIGGDYIVSKGAGWGDLLPIVRGVVRRLRQH